MVWCVAWCKGLWEVRVWCVACGWAVGGAQRISQRTADARSTQLESARSAGEKMPRETQMREISQILEQMREISQQEQICEISDPQKSILPTHD